MQCPNFNRLSVEPVTAAGAAAVAEASVMADNFPLSNRPFQA
ncbi:conserved hypothetical protein [delta proteobacterium NaphS2]|nr:conserved hypothetical protein [delta proteobacterium NaphS2]